jgi:hypothetical protein
MSDPCGRDEPANEVLDLYDVLPEGGDAQLELGRPSSFGTARATDARRAETEDDLVTSMIKGTGRNFAAIVGMFAMSLTAFVACTAEAPSDLSEVDGVQLSDAAQNAAHFVVAEALANVEKHSGARYASVQLRARRRSRSDQHRRRWDRRSVAGEGSWIVRSRRPARRSRWNLDGVLACGWSRAADCDDSTAALASTWSASRVTNGSRMEDRA